MYPRLRLVRFLLSCFALCFILTGHLCPPYALAEAVKPNTAILLVAFGSSVPEARDSLRRIEGKTREAFPGTELRWAYTSNVLRQKLAQEGLDMPSVDEALEALLKAGFSRVAVQSLHIVPGEEFHKTVIAVGANKAKFERLALGQPLMASPQDLERLAEVLPTCLPAERQASETVLFMGHGTRHPAGVFYPALQYYLVRKHKNVFLATVEGAPSLDDALPMLKSAGSTTVWLAPLMSVAGDHAQNDMAGAKDDSWVNVLARAGLKAKPVMRGLAQCDRIVDIWIEHLREALNSMDAPRKERKNADAAP